MIRERLGGSGVFLLNYTITSNHTHMLLIVESGGTEALSRFMQSLEGDFAQYYNRRKRRHGAFWTDRYHAVMIDRAGYTWACMKYIDLNMVRAGVVRHPEQWGWTGFGELMGLRRRNRVLDVERVLSRLQIASLDQFRREYRQAIEESLARKELGREAVWTESLGVGSQEYVVDLGRQVRNRMAVRLQAPAPGETLWSVHEASVPYGRILAPENGP
jgi:putative transposase